MLKDFVKNSLTDFYKKSIITYIREEKARLKINMERNKFNKK